MSYDLFFRSRPGGRPINKSTFAEYFSNRQRYTLRDSRALYLNEDTGVYFAFDLSESEEADPEAEPNDAAFELNYYRPHIFSLEAEPEVAAFVRAFDPLVVDDQINGMGEGGYLREGFFSGWNTGNEHAYRVFSAREGGSAFLLPTAAIEKYWKWNFDRSRTQAEVGTNIFVPQIAFVPYEGRVVSRAVWPDAIPILLPQVDFVDVVRDELAPRRWFTRKMDHFLVPWSDVAPLLSSFAELGEGLKCRRLDYSSRPRELLSWFRGLSLPATKREGITVDKILNQELWTRALEKKNHE